MSHGNKVDTVYFDEIFNETLDMIYKDILGVELASDNQYAMRLEDITDDE